jgi:hypothetical protein
MHDWTLKKIEFDWPSARVTIDFEDLTSTVKRLVAERVSDLHVPRANEWGPSVSVNEMPEVETLPSGLRVLKIEVQSGDVIRIVAERFAVP